MISDEKLLKQTIKPFVKKSDGNTPKQMKKGQKCDLKQYLTFSGSKQNEQIANNPQNIKTNYSTANNEKCNSYRINSESSITNLINSNNSNRKTVVEAMKALKFQKSSLDHQKHSLEVLMKSKSNLFSLLVGYDSTLKSYVS